MSQLLFSYGTLQYEKVQVETFGRKLKGTPEILEGYRLKQVRITDPDVLAKSEEEYHPIAVKSENENDSVEGVLFEITDEELAKADSYEVEDYKRAEVSFKSGKTGWIYVKR